MYVRVVCVCVGEHNVKTEVSYTHSREEKGGEKRKGESLAKDCNFQQTDARKEIHNTRYCTVVKGQYAGGEEGSERDGGVVLGALMSIIPDSS